RARIRTEALLDQHQLPVAQPHAVAFTHRRLALVGHVADAAVVHPDRNLVDLVAMVGLDLVTGEGAAQRTYDGQCGLARASAELVADHPAPHRAAYRRGVLLPIG